MNKPSMTFEAYFSRVMFAGTIASMLMLAGGWASAESTAAEKDYDKAVKEMQNGYAEIGQVVNDLDDDKNKTPERHFNTALKDFDKAVEYFAKAELPADEQPAVDSLKQRFR